jgi:hypothetical protein
MGCDMVIHNMEGEKPKGVIARCKQRRGWVIVPKVSMDSRRLVGAGASV